MVGEGSRRWRLSRAGIVNVYQYEHETIDLHGGRLLLRGVNGSGKSTAMNMLLPFLVTARQTRIDAAGEQTGVLKAWMLNGRDDPQPVGYLWLEFACNDRFVTCGCGIKANRSSDSVSTWWFLTDRRPGIDFELVEGKVPLSADALRATLDGPNDEVFNERQRRDYRRAVERRIFGGASIDQHVDLLNVVRNPRIGDRIDVELPAHLVGALPHLSERALSEAAQPLDDLETHRRNVDELARTRTAIAGLLDVYRPYVITQLGGYVAQGNDALANVKRTRSAEGRSIADRDAAERHRQEVIVAADRAAAEIRRLESEIKALRDSEPYRQGQQLDELRRQVRDGEALAQSAASELALATENVQRAGDELSRHERILGTDRDALFDALTALSVEAERLHVAQPPVPDVDLANPGPLHDTLQAFTGALRQRRGDLDDVTERRADVDRLARDLDDAGREHERAVVRHESARDQVGERQRQLDAARGAWHDDFAAWLDAAGLPRPAGDTEDELHRGASASLAARRADAERARASAEERLDQAVQAHDEAAAVVADLAGRREPEMAHAAWQRAEPVRVADLIDFHTDVTEVDRAGIEAALEASGLLTARLVDGGTVELQPGELVAVGADGVRVEHPLSRYLVASVPEGAAVEPADVERLLDAIATNQTTPSEPSDGVQASTVITTGGVFRVGRLGGRHHKQTAEFIGATARRAALARARAEAESELERCAAVVAGCEAEVASAGDAVAALQAASEALPSLRPIESARLAVEHAAGEEERTAAELTATEAAVGLADERLALADDELHRASASLRLPTDDAGLRRFAGDLAELERSRLDAAHRAKDAVRSYGDVAAARRREADAIEVAARAATAATEREDAYRQLHTRLATIEDSIGAEVAEVLAAIATSEDDLGVETGRAKELAVARDAAVAAATDATHRASVATSGREEAERECERRRVELADVVAMPGVLDAVGGDEAETRAAVGSGRSGVDGLTELVGQLAARLPDAMPPPVDAESVRMSLRQRRDSIGAGWDAEARQPILTRPLIIEVHGPTGRGTLADQHRVVDARFTETNNLLTRKQDDALRGLLQGLIAQELATKVDEAHRLIDLMNLRLSDVRTAHDVGVELRWRRSSDLDDATARLVELLSTLPDLRRPADDDELRDLLAKRLDEARRESPDLPYRELIGATLDYRQWHELAILLHRGGDRPQRLRRSTGLSEGEKKLVTYLPMFAAVAASYDALAAGSGETRDGDEPGPARFVLLDDAFAKVSEDNHAKLFGLIVDLDLDLIATSERLWGTHRTVPEIAITEVIRDADRGVILLEHYRWDGAVLERVDGDAGAANR